MLKIKAIEASNGVLINPEGDYINRVYLQYLFDGKIPKTTNHPNWLLIEKPITQIERTISGVAINHRYELIVKKLETNP